MPEALDAGGGPIVAGADGCSAGWIVVSRPLDDPGHADVRLYRTFGDLLALDPAPGIIAIDMPIGLPERAGAGGRRCDVAARAVLGGRQSSVFGVPSRAAVACEEYRQACRIAFATSEPARKVSKQAFYLFPKIRQIDMLMTPELQLRVAEVHPEAAFWALNGEQPLSEPKKVKSRPYPPGLELRQRLLEAAGYRREFLALNPFRTVEAGLDDLLDAAANSWSAARIALGQHRSFPTDPCRDGRGLKMEILC